MSSGDGDGWVERPDAAVLDGSAVVPAENVSGPPGRFTHAVVSDAPYWYRDVQPDQSDGVLLAGTPVLLVTEEAAGQCRVVDGRGLSVAMRREDLRPLR